MFDELNSRPLSNRETIQYQCSRCGRCCRNVRDSVMLEALDAFRLVKHLRSSEPERSPMELLNQYADLRLLSRSYSVFVLRTINDSGVCVFPDSNTCRIYPRTCKLYPFALEPQEDIFQWYLCLEQGHHFHGGRLTAREWGRKNLSGEDRAFLLEELNVLPKLGEVTRAYPVNTWTKLKCWLYAILTMRTTMTSPLCPSISGT